MNLNPLMVQPSLKNLMFYKSNKNMSIKSNHLSTQEYEQNFSDIHPPFETPDAALVEANRCLFC